MDSIIVGLDIGTCSIRVCIAEISDTGALTVIGLGVAKSVGLRRGLITNIEATMESIKTAIEDAEMMAGIEVRSCVTAIGGAQIETLISTGVVAVSEKDGGTKEISQFDIDRALDAAQAVNIPLDRGILHLIPRSYVVDENKDIDNPLNMLGVRLESEACLITASTTLIKTVVSCITRAGFVAEGVHLKTLVGAEAVFTDEEKELGSLYIDFGGGTTDVLVYAQGSPLCAISIPVGGDLVTRDLAVVMGIPKNIAEEIKIRSGCCWCELVSASEKVIIPGIGGNPPHEVSRMEICEIITARIEHIFSLIREKLPVYAKKHHLNGSIVLAGAGSCLPGLIELTSKEFKTDNVRSALPSSYGGQDQIYRSPEYATVIGLVLAGKKLKNKEHKKSTVLSTKNTETSFLKSVFNWFKEFF